MKRPSTLMQGAWTRKGRARTGWRVPARVGLGAVGLWFLLASAPAWGQPPRAFVPEERKGWGGWPQAAAFASKNQRLAPKPASVETFRPGRIPALRIQPPGIRLHGRFMSSSPQLCFDTSRESQTERGPALRPGPKKNK